MSIKHWGWGGLGKKTTSLLFLVQLGFQFPTVPSILGFFLVISNPFCVLKFSLLISAMCFSLGTWFVCSKLVTPYLNPQWNPGIVQTSATCLCILVRTAKIWPGEALRNFILFWYCYRDNEETLQVARVSLVLLNLKLWKANNVLQKQNEEWKQLFSMLRVSSWFSLQKK